MTDDVSFAVRTIDETTEPTKEMAGSYEALISKLAELNQSADVTNQYLGALTDTTSKGAQQNEQTGLSMSELNQGMEVFNKTLRYAEQAYQATIGVSQQYAEQIRNLSQVSGQSSEETSRFVQVLDDWQVSAEDAMTATKALTKQGLAPSTETLAKLSDQYLALNSVEDQNAFVTKNLGRAGLEWVNVLKQGGDALREQAAAVDANLILSEKQLKQAEQLRIAQDQLNDTVEGLKITVGTGLTPAFSAWVEVANRVLTGSDKLDKSWTDFIPIIGPLSALTRNYGSAFNELQAGLEGATVAQKAAGESAEELAEKQKLADEAAKALSQTYQTIFSLEQSIQSQTDSYASSVENLTTKQGELQDKIDSANPWETEKIAGYQTELDKIPPQLDALAAKNEEAMNKMIFSNIMAKDSVDGISAAEFARDQALGVSLGLFTEDAANRAIAINTLATAFHDGSISAEELQAKLASGTLGTPPEAITASWSGLQDRIKESTGTTATKIDEGITKVTNYADETKNKTDSVAEGWQTAAAAIEGSVNDGMGNIQRYIDLLGTIPTEINTVITQTITPPPVGSETQGLGGGRGGTNIYIQNAWFDRDGQISQMAPMLVVG